MPRVTAGLQALYTFLEGAGAQVNDVGGVGTPMDLAISNPEAVTWLPDGGIRIGAPTNISTPAPATKIMAASQLTNEVTYECWVFPLNLTQVGTRLMTNSNSTSGRSRNVTVFQEQAFWHGRLDTSGDFLQLQSSDGASLAPTHIVFTRDALGNTVFYINGQVVETLVRLGDFSTWDLTRGFHIANEATGDRPWLGDIFLAAVYSKALTQAEVSGNFNAGLPNAPPVASFAVSSAVGDAPLSVDITNFSSGDITSYNWDLGDGTVLTAVNPGTHVYSVPGEYTIILTVTGPNGSDTASTLISVRDLPPPPPVPDFTAQVTGLTAVFTNLSQADIPGSSPSYLWDFGDGSSGSSEVHPVHTYLAGGTYTVTLEATNADGSASVAKQVTVVDPLPPPEAPVADMTVVAFPDEQRAEVVEQSTGNITTWELDWGDGSVGLSQPSPLGAISHIYAAGGTYHVVLTVTGPGGSDSTSFTVPINDPSTGPLPTPIFEPSPDPADPLLVQFSNLSVDATSFVWDFGDGSPQSTDISPIHQYGQAGSYIVTLDATGTGGTARLEMIVVVGSQPAGGGPGLGIAALAAGVVLLLLGKSGSD